MAEEYFHQDYPRTLYHPDGRTYEVANVEEEATAKKDGFVRSPAEYGVVTCPAAPPGQPAGYKLQGYVGPASPSSASASASSAAAPSGTEAGSPGEGETSSRRSRY